MNTITWITGNSEAGKTTLLRRIQSSLLDCDKLDKLISPYYNAIYLDGNDMRGIWTDLGLGKKDRWEQNLRVARLAKMLADQGFNVVVAVICPYKKLRAEVKRITNCKFIYIEGGEKGRQYPYERPELY